MQLIHIFLSLVLHVIVTSSPFSIIFWPLGPSLSLFLWRIKVYPNDSLLACRAGLHYQILHQTGPLLLQYNTHCYIHRNNINSSMISLTFFFSSTLMALASFRYTAFPHSWSRREVNWWYLHFLKAHWASSNSCCVHGTVENTPSRGDINIMLTAHFKGKLDQGKKFWKVFTEPFGLSKPLHGFKEC